MTPTPHGQVPEAQTHAECLERFAETLPAYGFNPQPLKDSAAELRRLHAYCQELEAQVIRDCMSTQQAGARVYAFRRKGLADFCTCDEARYEELSNKPHLFETRIFYTAPQPSTTAQAAESVPAGPRRKDMLWSTAKMQERHDQRIENIVSGLERIKQEHAGQQPQKIDECYGDCPTDSTTCTNPCRFDGRAARAPADSVLEDAARWQETLMHVGAANHLGGQHFTLNTLRIRDQMFLLRGSVAQHFTACIDDSRAARKQGGAT